MHLDESARVLDHHPVEAPQLGLRPELQPATTRVTYSISLPRRRRDDDGRLSRQCLRETRFLEGETERREGLGLLYFVPWLRDARPGDMDTLLCNDIGSGDWASAGGTQPRRKLGVRVALPLPR